MVNNANLVFYLFFFLLWQFVFDFPIFLKIVFVFWRLTELTRLLNDFGFVTFMVQKVFSSISLRISI